jgi:hypothetical protein
MYPDSIVSCKATIYNLVTKLRYMRSVLDKNKCRKRNSLTEERLDDIDTRFEACPKKSLRLLIVQCGLVKGTAHVGT